MKNCTGKNWEKGKGRKIAKISRLISDSGRGKNIRRGRKGGGKSVIKE